MWPSRVVTIVSLSMAFVLPAAVAAAADEPWPPVTPFIDSEPVPPSKWAGGASVPPEAAATQPSRWYGGQIIAADLATLGCIALTQHGACVAPYLFAGLAIHAYHGQLGRAGLSVALRVYMPAIGGAVGGLIGGCGFSDEPTDGWYFPPCLGEMVIGTLVGVAAGMALDAALGFTPPPAPVGDSPVRAAVRLAPRLSLGQAHFSLGLSATF